MTGRFIGLNLARFRASAAAHHADFRRRAGSEQIASAYALAVLGALLETVHPRRVLEIGAGIGTMTTVLVAAGCEVHAVENHAGCAAALARTVGDRLSPGLGYLHDLIVVDGDQVSPAMALGLLKHRGWLLVEGNRRGWRAGLTYGYRPFVAVNLRPFDRSKGMWVLAFEPTPALRLGFAAERLWQGALSFLSRAWSVLSGATSYHGKRRVYDPVPR